MATKPTAQKRKPADRGLEITRNRIRDISAALNGIQSQGVDFETVTVTNRGTMTIKGLFNKAERAKEESAKQQVQVTGQVQVAGQTTVTFHSP